jgi:hypothetical protein
VEDPERSGGLRRAAAGLEGSAAHPAPPGKAIERTSPPARAAAVGQPAGLPIAPGIEARRAETGEEETRSVRWTDRPTNAGSVHESPAAGRRPGGRPSHPGRGYKGAVSPLLPQQEQWLPSSAVPAYAHELEAIGADDVAAVCLNGMMEAPLRQQALPPLWSMTLPCGADVTSQRREKRPWARWTATG